MAEMNETVALDLDSLPKIRQELWCPGSDGTVYVLGYRTEILMINKLGGMLWRLMDGTRTIREIIAAVRNELDDAETCEPEIFAFIRYAVSRGWLSLEASVQAKDHLL